MQLAVVAAGFTPGEADQLRRAMATWQRRGGLESFEERLIAGMRERHYTPEFAQQICKQIRGFGEYGFPESHAASFALLVYVSAWLKAHEPAAFSCALLNSQPMGFYAPAQLVRNARRSGIEVRPVDVNSSQWDCTLEGRSAGQPALRLGLRLTGGLSRDAAARLLEARGQQAFADVEDLQVRSSLQQHELGALAAAGALAGIAGHRYRARWEVAGAEPMLPLFPVSGVAEGIPLLRPPTEAEDISGDYASMGLSLGRHPLALLRSELQRQGFVTAEDLRDMTEDDPVRIAGLVITRQRPGSAGGVIFVTLEDETGYVNLIVWPQVAERQRRALLGSRLLAVRGRIQRQGDVLHVIVSRAEDRSAALGTLTVHSRDFA
mgnify:CR=1 FL=1